MPLQRQACLQLYDKVHAHCSIDAAALHTYLQQRKVVAMPVNDEHLAPTLVRPVQRLTAKMMLQHPLSEANLQALYEFKKLLVLKGYSPNTYRTYFNEFHLLLRKLTTTIYTLPLGIHM